MTNASILIVAADEPDGPGLSYLEKRLQDLGYVVCAAVASGPRALGATENAVGKAAQTRPDLALIDLGRDGDGIDVAEQLAIRFDVPLIYLTDDADGSLLQRARLTGPFGYVLKPYDERQLRLTIDAALAMHERHRIRQERARREPPFIVEDMGFAVIVTDKNGFVTFMNSVAEQLTGCQNRAAFGRQLTEVFKVTPEQEVTVRQLMMHVRRQEGAAAATDRHVALIGKPQGGIHVDYRIAPLRDNRGGIALLFHDITRLTQAEAELKQQAQLMETIFNSLSDGVVVTDTKGGFLYVNTVAQKIVGMAATDAPADEWSDTYGVYYPDKETPFPSDRLPLVRAMHGEIVDDVELFIRNHERPDGVYISVNARPLQQAENGPLGGVIVFRNITELKETEAKLHRTIDDMKRQAQLMETTFNSISDGVVVADGSGKFNIFNPSAERIVGMGMTDTGPAQWAETYGLFQPDQVTPVPIDELPLLCAIRGEAFDDVEIFIRNPKTPHGAYISVSGRPLHGQPGIGEGGVIVFRDVTERKRAEEELIQAFAQGRLQVVDTILHNIGNAINSIATGVGTIHERLLKNDLIHRMAAVADALAAHRDDWITYLQTDPQGRMAIPFILALAEDLADQNEGLRRTVERVESRVAHIVDIIRTQRSLDDEAMVRKDVELHKTIIDAVKMLDDSLVKRGVEMCVDCQHAPRVIRIQESRFHQMLVNLVKNAIEAIDSLAESGGPEAQPRIWINAYVRDDLLVLDVIDNGIGIEPDRSEAIFSAGYTTKEKGSGLGLHSAANFIIGSGGSIRSLSDGIGTGTTIRIALRLSLVTPRRISR